MATRASIILQTQKQLHLLGAGLNTTDDASGDFHYPLNYTLSRMRKVDSDVASFSSNEERTAVQGTEYYVLAVLAKKYYGMCTEDGTAHFKNILRLLGIAAKEFQRALNGEDIPDAADEIAEEIVVWGSEFGDRSVSSSGDGASQKTAPFHVNEFGTDESSYEEDDTDW